MKKYRLNLIIILFLICAMIVNLTGCTKEVQTNNLMKDITSNKINPLDDLTTHNIDVTDFAIRLFKASEESGKNTLISPLSILCALAMTTNGASDDTLKQMESVLGMTKDELNLYIYSYMNNLPQSDEAKLKPANSIWFSEDKHFTIKQDFLQSNADYYGADIYKVTFNNKTCDDINNWVKEKSDEMIPEIIDEIPKDAMMYLINALAFDAKWQEVYKEHQVQDGKFTKEDGSKQKVEYMYSSENKYLKDDKAIGFMKYYYGNKYAFVAMLPNEGINISEYIASLNGEALNKMISNPKQAHVETAIPKFEVKYNVEMSQILKAMGVTNAFDPHNAQFKNMITSDIGNVYINRILHKSFISVGEQGTKAGGATAVEISKLAMAPEPLELKRVYLNRPFVYMLIDCENKIPFFIGTMMSVD